MPAEHQDSAAPLYASVKQHILSRIHAGAWRPGQRVPSENELVMQLGVSRMTVNRALRELSQEGALVRVQGRGSFVAEGNNRTDVFEVGSIADEIAGRGHRHAAIVVELAAVEATAKLAESLGVSKGANLFHSVLVHTENGIPVQLEDRHVNPVFAPDYLGRDFTAITPNEVLSAAAPWSEAEHRIEAVLPQAWEARLLGITRADPCLLINRRTFAMAADGDNGAVVTAVRLLMPGGRTHIASRRRAAP